jgi:hypothetical protein
VSLLHDFQIPRFLDYEGTTPKAFYGLDKPAVVVTVKARGRQDAVVEVGKAVAEADVEPGFYAVVRGRKQVFLLPKATLDALLAAFDALVADDAPRPKQ